MNAEEPRPEDESLLTRLIACDEALAAGTPPHEPPASDTPVEWLPRLEGNLACIQVLRKVLPRRTDGATPGLPVSSGGPVVATDLPFRELGRFHIKRRLGQGAFGVVFLAADPQLGREVALKVPRPEALMTGEMRERFLREARAAAGLDHPNLVAVYEAGSVGPLCYIASAYCPGVTLSEWLKQRTELPPERLAAGLVATLADGVGHAHSRGVVHRDLKPSNVLLQGKRRDPTDGNSTVVDPGSRQSFSDSDWEFVPRITDFGLAKLIGDATALAQTVDNETRTGAVLGTPNYMAPEQASGKNKEIGPAADVYALGVILYELLTGSPPFRGESLLDTLEQVRTEEPVPPGRLRAKLSRDLETICLKCLQKEPHQRYPSAADLADDLRRYLAHEPIQARPIRAWERGIKWARRRPAPATLLVVCLLAPLVVAGLTLAYNTKLTASNDKLKDALDAEKEQRQLAQENEWDARNFSYVSDMNLSQQDWASARLERLRELLLRHEPPPNAKDLRGFEWYYWKHLLDHSALRTLSRQKGEICCLACSPDGKLLVSVDKTVSKEKSKWTIHLWDASSGDSKGLLGSAGFPIDAVTFTEEGRTVAVASGSTVKLFDLARSKPPSTLTNRGMKVTALAVAGRGQTLAVARFDGSVEIWDLTKKTRLHVLRRHQTAAHALVLSSDGHTLASGDAQGIIHLWDVPSFQWRASYSNPPNRINGIAFAPAGKLLATAGNDATVRLWDLEGGKERAVLTGHTEKVSSVQFTPDGKQLVSAGADATVRVWDSDGTPRLLLKGHTGPVRNAIFTANGRTIVSAGSDGSIKLWDARRNPEHSSWDCHDEGVLQLAFAPDGATLATGGADGYVQLWEAATGRHLSTLPPYPRDLPRITAAFGVLTGRMGAIGPQPPRPIQGLAFTPDGKHLAFTCLDLCVHIWDHQQAREAALLKGHSHEVTALSLNADGTLLASGDLAGAIHVWDWQRRETRAVCLGHKEGIRALAFSPDGKLLASGGTDGTIKLWESETALERRTLTGHEGIVSGLSFSPDGRSLASGGEDGKVCLWAVDAGELRKRLHGHLGSVRSLAFSPDGLTLASTSGEVKLWHVTTGRELATFILPGTVFGIAWAPRAQLLAGGGTADGRHGFVTLWKGGAESK